MATTLPFTRPGKIVCVGRNYADHAKELGNATPAEPLLFLKPPSAVIGPGDPIRLPTASTRVEHEGEIGVVIGSLLACVDAAEARRGVFAITCANDVTARDLQTRDGQWTRAKGFDTFCPIGPRLLRISPNFDISALELRCRVNGSLRQHAFARDMRFSVPELLAYISHVMTLEPGDLVLTGTPAGVGPLVAGDQVEVEIPEVGLLANPVIASVDALCH